MSGAIAFKQPLRNVCCQYADAVSVCMNFASGTFVPSSALMRFRTSTAIKESNPRLRSDCRRSMRAGEVPIARANTSRI